MATKLFLRNTQTNGIGATYYDMRTTAGAASDTAVVNTTSGGTEIQWTKTAGGAVIQWISGRVPSGGFTLTTTDISVWCVESAVQANAGGRFRVFKRTSGGVETELAGGPFSDGVEFSDTTNTEMLWVGNVTDTAFAEDDRILLKLYITNVGTMGASRTCTVTFNAADTTTGDSFFNIAETVAFKPEVVAKAVTVTQARTRTITRHVFERNLISVAQGISVAQIRGAPKAIAVSMPQNANGLASAMIAVAATTGDGLLQAVTAVGNFVAGGGGATTQKAISVVQAQAVTLRNALTKLITATIGQDASGVALATISVATATGTGLAQTVTATAVKFSAPIAKLISVVQTQAITLRRSAVKLVTVLQGSTVSVSKRAGHLISVTMASAVTVFRVAGHLKLITVTQAQLVTVTATEAAAAAIEKIINVTASHAFNITAEVHSRATIGIVTMGQNVSGVAHQTFNVAATTGAGLLQVVTAFAAMGGVATQKLVSVLQSQAVTVFTTLVEFSGATQKLISLTQSHAFFITAEVHLRSATIGLVTMGQNVTAFAAKAAGAVTDKLLTVLQAQSIVVFRNITGISGKLIAISQQQAITLRRSLVHRFTVATTQTVTVLRSIGHRIAAVTMAQAVTRFAIRARPKALSITQAQLVTARRQAGKLAAVTTAQAITAIRRIVYIVRVSTAQSITLVIDSVAQVRLKVVTLATTQAVTVLRNFARLFVILQEQAVTVFGAFARRIRRGSVSRGAPGDARDNTPDDIRHNTSIGIRKNTDPWHSS